MVKRQKTVDSVYDWAARHDVPAPDAFAVSHVGLDGHDRLLRLAAARWRRLVATKKTGFPLIDGD